MIITSITQQVKNAERASIFIDGTYAFSLSLEQLLQEKLKRHQVIDEARLKQLIKLSDEGKIRSRTLDWLMRRPHSVKELRDYFYRKKVDVELADVLIEEMQVKGYVNDEAFTRWFVEQRVRKNKSKKAIEAELQSKGVAPQTIQSVVSEQKLDMYQSEILKVLINKLRKKPRYSDDTKLIQYLLRKGFVYDDIRQVLLEF